MTASSRRGCLERPECHEGADQVVTRGRASGQGVQWQAAEEGTDLGEQAGRPVWLRPREQGDGLSESRAEKRVV